MNAGARKAEAKYRRVVFPVLLREPPPTFQPLAIESGWQRLWIFLLRPLWGFRVEIVAACVALVAFGVLAWHLGAAVAGLVMAAVVGVVGGVPGPRRVAARVLRRSQLRRRWRLAVRHARLATSTDRVPKVVRIKEIPSGHQLRVRVPYGGTVAQLEDAAEVIAAVLEVRAVRVSRDRDNARYASVVVVRRDPLSGGGAIPWPEMAVLLGETAEREEVS